MEFNEKLRELRKSKSLTQEELAETLFVSRTAVSKWESGRGYPSIDSLKEISRFFAVPVDELICPDEVIVVAEREKKALASTYICLTCGALDMFLVVLLFLPAFGNGANSPETVTLLGLTEINPWMRTAFAAVIGATVLGGVGEAIIASLDKPTWSRRLLTAGMLLSIASVYLFIATRQPYAGIICFALLAIKSLLMNRAK